MLIGIQQSRNHSAKPQWRRVETTLWNILKFRDVYRPS